MTAEPADLSESIEAQVVRVLRDHISRGVIDGWAYCKCGWFVREHGADAHRRHIARGLAAAGLVKQ
jgi:uncharacterized protein YfaT (DUF1175 family)